MGTLFGAVGAFVAIMQWDKARKQSQEQRNYHREQVEQANKQQRQEEEHYRQQLQQAREEQMRQDNYHRQQIEQLEQQNEQLRQQRLREDRKDAGMFLSAVADSLDTMVKVFRKTEGLPYSSGNRFKILLEKYDKRMRPYFGAQVEDDLGELEELAHIADEMDDDYASIFGMKGAEVGRRTGKQYPPDFKPDKEEQEEYLARMERMAGQLRARADGIADEITEQKRYG